MSFYYKHGPLAQTILGQLQVQKQDHVYTLQGWLKGINPAMGGTLANGTDTTEAFPTAQDAYGFSLHYYKKDYEAIGYTPQGTSVLGALSTNATPLFNGNIAAMAVNIPKLGTNKVYNYHYDQLNRIVAMDVYNGLNVNSGTFTPISVNDYKERVSYDPNGNIITYTRNGDAARLSMDDLSYFYTANTNRLHKGTDAATDAAPGDYNNYNDIKQGQTDNNYQYDEIGNLTADNAEGITNVTWNVYGKMASLTKSGSLIKYVYDASGNRIMKQTATDTTIYVRDATGSVLSVYSKPANNTLVQSETHLYGSSRLGMATQHAIQDSTQPMSGGFASGIKRTFVRGEKLFELNNHLENVLVTVTDRKIAVSAGGGSIDYYKADISSANDYYPFGMAMSGRKFSTEKYRYGFNGQEKSNEISGEGNSYTAEFWEYNPLTGIRWNLDPRPNVGLSPYATFGGNPILYMDIKGDSIVRPTATSKTDDNYRPWMSLMTKNAPSELLELANKRFTFHTFSEQRMSEASGLDMNKDLYTAEITKLPPGYTASQLFEYIRLHMEEFIEGKVSKFSEYNKNEGTVWRSSNPNSAIMRFKGYMLGAQVDDADVITTSYTNTEDYSSWTFRPVSDYNMLSNYAFWSDKQHPLAGNREFGMQKLGQGYTFYIQGVDRLWSKADELFVGRKLSGGTFFKLANELWIQVMERVVVRIHNLGGEAKFNSGNIISNRIDYNNSVSSTDKEKVKASGN